jgi:hypothetical protein
MLGRHNLNQRPRFRAKLAPVRARIMQFQAVSSGPAAHPTRSDRVAASASSLLVLRGVDKSVTVLYKQYKPWLHSGSGWVKACLGRSS